MKILKFIKKLSRNIKIALLVLLVVLLSQLVIVKMVYAGKLNQNFSESVAGFYNLKAGSIKEENKTLNIYLNDYFKNKKFIISFLESQQDNSGNTEMPSDEQIKEIVWKKLVKNTWINSLADENDIKVEPDEIEQYLDFLGGKEKLMEVSKTNFNISFEEYEKLVVKPSILEAKVHDYLLSNYQDVDGVSKIQEAYALLERDSGATWSEVAKMYSDDQTYVEDSLWLKESELVSFYEPIKELQVGEFSKIVKTPLGYIIWKLDDIDNSGQEAVWQARAIFVMGKDIEDFFDEYLEKTEIKKKY
ncbi:hypothetical protein KKH39_03380 [Patescibacteria group bacterium]|nr:hypothetical protein [Patescibacteria group bacterium]